MIKTLWIKDESLRPILDGRKTIEVRVGYNPRIFRPSSFYQKCAAFTRPKKKRWA